MQANPAYWHRIRTYDCVSLRSASKGDLIRPNPIAAFPDRSYNFKFVFGGILNKE